MKILFIDPYGDALDLALRSKAVGHEVKYFIGPAERYRLIGRGLVERVFDFKPHLRWADFVFLADNTKYLKQLDAFRRDYPATPVFGPTDETATWEVDRLKGMKVLEDHGISTPPSKQFSTYEQAVAYVKKRDTRLACKPICDADKALSYCAKSPEDLLFMLAKWKREGKFKPVLLQDFVEGTEFGVSAYFGCFGYGGGWWENWQFKKAMPGDKGPNTGETGTVIKCLTKSKLANLMLKPFEKTLIEAGYSGCIDVGCIIDDKGTPWPLEFTMRPGYPALQIETMLYPDDDPIQWAYDLTIGKSDPKFNHENVSLGVTMCLPPFPYPSAPLDIVCGNPVFGVTPLNEKHIHPYQVQRSNWPGTEWMSAGEYLLVVTGTSATVSGAKENAYRRMKQLNVPGSAFYRDDIGERLSKQIPDLQKLGFAKNWTFS